MTEADDWYGWHAPRVVNFLKSAASEFGRTWMSPAGAASCALKRLRHRRDARAAEDPRWAEIEVRRLAATDGEGNVTISDDFDLRDVSEQGRIARRITPDPRWAAIARRVAERAQLWKAALRVERRVQRARLGWDEGATVNADRHLSRIVGQLLLAYDQLGWTSPNGGEWPSADAWHEVLTANAKVLAAYGTNPTRRPEGATLEDASKALHWVADQLHNLSD